MPNINGLK